MSRRLLYLLFCYALLSACSQTLVDLHTPNGQLQGYIDGEVEHYMGVPYASPPTGERRWRAPQPASPWPGKREALELPEMCAQTSLFSGDLIFKQGIGRTDLLGGSYSTLMESIQKYVLPLPDETRIYSGHGPETTVGEERRENPFLR